MSLWARWVLASAVGGLLSGAIYFSFGLPGLLPSGVLLGLTQGLVLRGLLPRTRRWIAATAVAVPLGWAATFLVWPSLLSPALIIPWPAAFIVFPVLAFGVAGALAGLIVGALQWQWVLKGHLPVGRAWIAASILAGIAFAPFAVGLWLGVAGGVSLTPRAVLFAGLGGSIYGAVTGIALLPLERLHPGRR